MEQRRILSPDQVVHQEKVMDSLAAVVAGGESILLVGSGCSRPMFPSWGELVEKLAALAGGCIPTGYTLPPKFVEDKPAALQHIRDAVQQYQADAHCLERFERTLIRLFEMDGHDPGRIHELLVRMPFRAYLTTNYDKLIEYALPPGHEDRALDVQTAEPLYLSRAIRAITRSGAPEKVIHLHGIGDHPKGMILTTVDYQKAYGLAVGPPGGLTGLRRPPYAKTIMSALMMTRRLVFVGFGLEDPFLMRVLKNVTAEGWEWDSPVHYAIRPISDGTAAGDLEMAKLLRGEYGVEVLFYEVRNDDHSALGDILEEVAGRVSAARPPSEVDTAKTPHPVQEYREEPDQTAGGGRPDDALETLSRARIRRNLLGLEEDGDED